VQERAQLAAVGVDRVRALVKKQVAREVREHEAEQDRAGHGHDDLLADRGREEAPGAHHRMDF